MHSKASSYWLNFNKPSFAETNNREVMIASCMNRTISMKPRSKMSSCRRRDFSDDFGPCEGP